MAPPMLLALAAYLGVATGQAVAEPAATPCRAGSALHREATRALEALDTRIRALAPHDNPEPANQALAALLAHPCMRLAKSESPQRLEADSALALAAFWDQSGRPWLMSYLDMNGASPGDRDAVVPANMRTTLSRETLGGHPLAPLLCSLRDPDCGTRTRGWALRAEQAFERSPRARKRHGSDDDAQSDAAQCEQRAREEPERRRYQAWRECIEALPPRLAALPHGGLDVPTDGWLVIRGRRGHYSFCDEIRAYDLATGAAFIAQSCSGLALAKSGRVDQTRTDRGRVVRARAGRLSRDNLREAAWMTLLTPFVDKPAVRTTHYYSIPAGIAPRRPPSVSAVYGGVYAMSSAQTTLAWSYVRAGEVLASGTLTWPSDYNDAAREHAVRLLEIAEAGFVDGCPRAVPPAGLLSAARLGATPGVSALDASKDSLSRAEARLVQAMERLEQQARTAPGCP